MWSGMCPSGLCQSSRAIREGAPSPVNLYCGGPLRICLAVREAVALIGELLHFGFFARHCHTRGHALKVCESAHIIAITRLEPLGRYDGGVVKGQHRRNFSDTKGVSMNGAYTVR